MLTHYQENARVTRVVVDGSLQGFELTDRLAFCFQGHPEASPGPHDMDYLFDRFVNRIKESKINSDPLERVGNKYA